jgi:hypothetical protein
VTAPAVQGYAPLRKPEYDTGETYMKLRTIIVFYVLLGPTAVFAGEKALYDIGQDICAVVERYAACAARNGSCTEDEARAVQSDAESSLRDLEMLIRSGSAQRIIITAGQARRLSERANSVRGRLAQIELFDALCNRVIRFTQYFFSLMAGALYIISMILGYGGIGAVNIVIVIALGAGLLLLGTLVLASFFLMAPCLFWWL